MAQSPLPLSKSSVEFPPELEPKLINAVKGKSSIAALCGATPIPFNGLKQFVFNMESEISIVGESGKKPAAAMTLSPITVTPFKVVYQSRVTDEFMYGSRELRIDIMSSFIEGQARKMAKGLDLTAFHGVDPATGNISTLIPSYFDGEANIPTIEAYANSSTIDQNIEDAIAAVQEAYYDPTGIALSPECRRALAQMTLTTGERFYPQLAWGAAQATMNGREIEENVTVSAFPVTDNGSRYTDMAIVGDFQSAFRWGYSLNNQISVIEYGDPDGSGYDLKAYNQVMLRSEAYIGFAVLDPAAFAIVKKVESV